MLPKTTSTALQCKAIPGPHSLNPLESTLAFRHHPLQFLAELQKQYGDIAQFRLLIWPTVFINHPDYVKHVLQDNHRNYDKDVVMFRNLRPVAGNGLVSAVGGNDWLRQRRLVQPAFHHRRIAALGTLMTNATSMMLQQWDTYVREQQVFDLGEEMADLTLQIVSEALFKIDVSAKNSFRQAFAEVNAFLIDHFYVPFPPLFIHTPRNHRFWLAIEALDAVVYEIIHNRRQQQEDMGDLLSMLLDAVDENGQRMDDKQLRDEIMTLLLAGHETSANTLAWVWYLLTQHPEVQERLHAEVDQILTGRIPTVEDLPQLNYTRMVLEEAMRLYPLAWQLMRRAIQADEIDGYHIPANSYILWRERKRDERTIGEFGEMRLGVGPGLERDADRRFAHESASRSASQRLSETTIAPPAGAGASSARLIHSSSAKPSRRHKGIRCLVPHRASSRECRIRFCLAPATCRRARPLQARPRSCKAGSRSRESPSRPKDDAADRLRRCT